jgi:A/G-specific adenine glycosylase
MKKALFTWSEKEYSELPWRKERTLYRTLVSEIMLQQTNVSTVLKHFERFLKVFPNLPSLAVASEEEVCAQWQGLGYYRRARNLRKAAVTIVEQYNGEFPSSLKELISIPGIGVYTANALLAIGRNENALALDANLERVISRLYGLRTEKGPKLLKEIQQQEEKILKDFKVKTFGARAINESLMDLGRVYCQAKKADCLLCPLREKCFVFTHQEDPLQFPVTQEKTKVTHDLKLLRVIVKDRKGQILGYKKNEKEWLSGQIELPTFILETTDKKLKQYPAIDLDKGVTQKSIKMKTAITKYKITNLIIECSKKEFRSLLESNNVDLSKYTSYQFDLSLNHFSTATLKSINAIDLRN